MLPDRKEVTMEVGFMDAYVRLLIKTCHKLSDVPIFVLSLPVGSLGRHARNVLLNDEWF